MLRQWCPREGKKKGKLDGQESRDDRRFLVVLLPGAFYFAVKDQIGIVSALMGIFVLSVLTLSLPRLRLIEAFGIKGELAEAVRKAELTLEQFKRLARSSARQGFQQMKTGNGRYLPFVEKRGRLRR